MVYGKLWHVVNYYGELWVPRANLYDALLAVETQSETLFLRNIVMPDGRRFPSHPQFGDFAIRDDWQPALSMQTYLTIDLPEDETLRDWNRENRLQNGLYMVDSIELEIDDLPYNRQWLESEADLILFRFGANTRGLNSVIAYSDSLHRWAVDFARGQRLFVRGSYRFGFGRATLSARRKLCLALGGRRPRFSVRIGRVNWSAHERDRETCRRVGECSST